MLLQQGGAGTSAGSFANLYFGTGASAFGGSDVGFEVTNATAFSPGSPNPPVSTAGTGIAFTLLNGGTGIEFAVPFTFFETDPLGLGFDTTSPANPDIVLRLSQTFGYSVAGGATYGNDRLGAFVDPIVATTPTDVPEPASMALLGVSLVGARLLRKRETASA